MEQEEFEQAEPRLQAGAPAEALAEEPAEEPAEEIDGKTMLLPDDRFRRLDRRIVQVWTIGNLLGYGLALLFVLPWAIYWGLRHPMLLGWVLLGWVLLLAAALWLSFWRPPRLYRAWGWRIDDRLLETQSGLLFQRRRLLPLNRLQHVDLRRGPIERIYGLASLILHTAGTQSANLTIPGLEVTEAMRLRDHLVEKGGGDDAV